MKSLIIGSIFAVVLSLKPSHFFVWFAKDNLFFICWLLHGQIFLKFLDMVITIVFFIIFSNLIQNNNVINFFLNWYTLENHIMLKLHKNKIPLNNFYFEGDLGDLIFYVTVNDDNDSLHVGKLLLLFMHLFFRASLVGCICF